MIVLVPADAGARAESFRDLWLIFKACPDDLERSRQECRAVLHRQGESLFGRQGVAARFGVVSNVSAGRIGVQPFALVSLSRGHLRHLYSFPTRRSARQPL